MCGIIGIVSNHNVTPRLVEGLKRLEYRGYDSSGIAVLASGNFVRARAEGKIVALEKELKESPVSGTVGIAHTRWATHGAPNTLNAHPHMTDRVCVVHNGIIENFQALRAEMQALGYGFESQTDTEVIPVLLTHYLTKGLSPEVAFAKTLARLEGAFALAVLIKDAPETFYIARRGAPQAIGVGEGEMFVASDAYALALWTRKVIYLEEGDWAIITADKARIFTGHNQPVERLARVIQQSASAMDKGEYRHYMLKEIYEQPEVVSDTLRALIDPATRLPSFPEAAFGKAPIRHITLIGCGTSYYAAMTAQYWLEQYTRLPVRVDIASEFRYREPVLPEGGMVICISQSGETADTLAALRYAKAAGQHTLALVNVTESSLAREADAMIQTYAGPEIGVASTKAFTAQLTALACFTIALAAHYGTTTHEHLQLLVQQLLEAPAKMGEVLRNAAPIQGIAHAVARASDVLFIGRGTAYAIALEGALKLKEISYIHAEAYAAGELKHGPIALVDKNVPVVVIAPPDALFEKTASNMQEVAARGGKVLLFANADGVRHLQDYSTAAYALPDVPPFVAPLIYVLPLQLLAYQVAVLKGTDVDQPRNLAKSVTVE
jgi:glucosamine--fructose-6-phosphate aminotransferase (isomerizing)